MGRIVAAVFVVAACSAAPPPAPSAEDTRRLADEACPRVTAPYLYRIEKSGAVSHLLGTRHAGVALAKFPPFVERAFSAADKLVVESTAHDAFEPTAPLDPTVEDQLGGDAWRKYRMLVGAEHADRVNERSIGAAVAALLLLYEDTGAALDRELERRALAASRPVVGLEDAAQTRAVSDELLDLDGLKQMVNTIGSRADLRSSTKNNLAEYCSGRLEAGRGRPATSTARRNRRWMPTLEELLAKGGAFIAVGTMHLIGDDGLVRALRDRGYRVDRLTQ